MATEQTQVQNGSAFISYSRKDKEFVRKLYDGLVANNVKAWVDWEGIPLSADWMDEITRAVNGADAFLVVISPDWLASKVCAQEMELGLKSNKKLVPILRRAPEPGTEMHEKLASTNWVYLRDEDDFSATLPRLVEAINTDLEWVRDHTRLLERATEWETSERNSSFLLRGADLQSAESWMNQAAMKNNREVLSLQADYILDGRKEAIRRQRVTTIAISLALVVSLALGVLAAVKWRQADTYLASSQKSEAAAIVSKETAIASEATAIVSENNARENEIKAKESEERAKQNEILAKAQRNAAEAQLYQGKAGALDTSTLLAIDSLNIYPSSQAEDIIRQNLSYMPIPVQQMSQVKTGAVENQITNIEFNPDGTVYATNGFGGLACVWDASTNEKRYCVEQGKAIYDAVFTRDGAFLVTASDDGVIDFWNAADGTLVKPINTTGEIHDLEISPDGKWLAAASQSKMIIVINLQDPDAKRYELLEKGPVEVVKISPDSKWLASGNFTGEVSLHLLGNSFSIPGPNHDGKEILSIAFSPDSQLFVSAGADSKARIARTESGKEIKVLSHGDWVEDISFSPDGKTIVAAADDNRVWRWDVATGQAQPRLHHDNYVMKARFSPNGRWIASTGSDQTLRIWDAVSGNLMLQASLKAIGSGLAFSRDGKRVIVSDRGGNIDIWDISQVNNRLSNIKFSDVIHEIKLAPSGEWVAVNTDDFNVWKINTPDLLSVRDGTQGTILFKAEDLTYNLEISPDSNWVVVAETNKLRAVLYNVNEKVSKLLEHGSQVTDIAFTPDSREVATSGKDKKVILWDLQTGGRLFELENTAPVLSLAISPDGKYLVAGLDGRDATAVWDLTKQEKVADLVQSGNVSQIVFSPDGKWLATGDNLGAAKLWDAEKLPTPVAVYEMRQTGSVTSLAFSPDSSQFLTGSFDGFVHIWDLTSGHELSRLPHLNSVTGLTFFQDSSYLLTASLKIIQIWEFKKIDLVPYSELVSTACGRLVSNLSQATWEAIYVQEQYRLICPNLPQGKN